MINIGTLEAILRLRDELTPQLLKTGKTLDQFGNKMKSVGKTTMAAITLPLMGAAYGLIKVGASAEELESRFSLSFGKMEKQTRDWSEQLKKDVGGSAYAFRDYATTLNEIAIGMGVSETAAQGMSTRMIELAKDISSFTEVPMEQALGAVRSGLVDSTEPLRTLGIVMTQGTINAYAYEKGIAEVGAKLTTSQQAMARYGLMLELTSRMQGDAARTVDSAANSLAAVKGEIADLSRDLGRELLPVWKDVLVEAREWIDHLKDAVEWFKNLSPEQKEFYIKMVAVAAILPVVVFGLGQMIIVLSTLTTTAIPAAIGALTKLGIALGVGTGGLAFVVGAVVAAIILVDPQMKKFTEKLRKQREEADKCSKSIDGLVGSTIRLKMTQEEETAALIAFLKGVAPIPEAMERVTTETDDLDDSMEKLIITTRRFGREILDVTPRVVAFGDEIETTTTLIDELNLGVNQLTPGIRDAREATDEQEESMSNAREEAENLAQTMFLLSEATGQDWLKAAAAGNLAAVDLKIAMEEGEASAQDYAQAFLQMAMAMKAVTDEGTKTERALKGAMTGAMMGAQIAGPWGAAAGGIIGGLVGIFRGGGVENQIRDVARDMGTTITEELAKSIKDSGRPAQLAIAAIFEEGGMSIDRFAEEIGDLFSVFERGEITKPELITALEQAIPALIANLQALGPAGEAELQRIISAAQAMGIEFEGLSELIQGTFAPDTLEEMMEKFDMTNEQVRELADELGINLQTNLEKMAATIGLSVDEFKALGEAVSEKYGIPMEDIGALMESMGVTAEELAAALGVDVSTGAGEVGTEMSTANLEILTGRDLAADLADQLERAAIAASGINITSSTENVPGFQHFTPQSGLVFNQPSLIAVAEKAPERVTVRPAGERAGGDMGPFTFNFTIDGAEDPEKTVQYIESNVRQSMIRIFREAKSKGVN